MAISHLSEVFPPPSKFNESDLPDLSGKVCIVTGGNSGIGKETVRVLLQHGAKVNLVRLWRRSPALTPDRLDGAGQAARSEEKAKAAIEDLKKTTGKSNDDVVFLKLDLSTVKGAKEAAAAFIRKEERLHLIFNNAGVLSITLASTPDGYELTWGVCVVGPFAFTETLLPTLIATAATSPPNTVRIVTTSSSGISNAPPGGINLEDQTLGGNTGAGGATTYGQAKLANIMMANSWAKTLKEHGIISTSVDPGNVRTELPRGYPAFVRFIVVHQRTLLLYPVPLGALTQLYAATSPEVTVSDTGAYFVPWARRGAPRRPEATDEDLREKFVAIVRAQVDAKL